MQARQLFQAGQLDEAIEALGAEVRDNPTDAQRRAFLFELLCFAGQYDRAEKQLSVLGTRWPRRGDGRAAVSRRAPRRAAPAGDVREAEPFPCRRREVVGGTINGQPFTTITDADPRIGPRLEVFAGRPVHVAAVRARRDGARRSAQASARSALGTGHRATGRDASRDSSSAKRCFPPSRRSRGSAADGAVRLGRVTEWVELEDGGQAPSVRRCCSSTTRNFRSWSCASWRSRTVQQRRVEAVCRCAMSC